MSADDRAATHLSRLGVNPITIARLRGYASEDDMTLRDLVRFVLSDYAPPDAVEAGDTSVVHLDDRRR